MCVEGEGGSQCSTDAPALPPVSSRHRSQNMHLTRRNHYSQYASLLGFAARGQVLMAHAPLPLHVPGRAWAEVIFATPAQASKLLGMSMEEVLQVRRIGVRMRVRMCVRVCIHVLLGPETSTPHPTHLSITTTATMCLQRGGGHLSAVQALVACVPRNGASGAVAQRGALWGKSARLPRHGRRGGACVCMCGSGCGHCVHTNLAGARHS